MQHLGSLRWKSISSQHFLRHGAYGFITFGLFMNTRGCTYWKAKVDWFRIHLFWHEKKRKDENVFLEKPTVIVELPGCYKAAWRGSRKLRLPGSNSHRESCGDDSSFLFGSQFRVWKVPTSLVTSWAWPGQRSLTNPAFRSYNPDPGTIGKKLNHEFRFSKVSDSILL